MSHEEYILEVLKTREIENNSGDINFKIIIDNLDVSERPDFISKCGKYGIEEFIVPASNRSRKYKGNKYKNSVLKDNKQFHEKFLEKFREKKESSKLIELTESKDYTDSDMNVEMFRKNFVDITQKHLSSMQVYKEKCELVYFLVTCDHLLRGFKRDEEGEYQEIFNPLYDLELVKYMKSIDVDGWIIIVQDNETILNNKYTEKIMGNLFHITNTRVKDDFNIYAFSKYEMLKYELKESDVYLGYMAIDQMTRIRVAEKGDELDD